MDLTGMYEVPCGALVTIDLWRAGGARCPEMWCPGVLCQTVCYVSPGWVFAVYCQYTANTHMSPPQGTRSP